MAIAYRNVYQDPNVVSQYAQADYLEPAERTLLDILLTKHPQFRMLDVAVGAGRTTSHFAPFASEYIAIDFSPEMIAACQRRFDGLINKAAFRIADMRSLEWLADNSFDFILISYNAIGGLKHAERLAVFKEMRRICSPEGLLYFSAHNLQCLHKLFSFSAAFGHISPLHPKCTYWDLRKWWLRKVVYNPLTIFSKSKRGDYAMVNDGAENFRLQMYYVRPQIQVQQLSSFFNHVRVFGRNGREIHDPAILTTTDDDWLFYLASDLPASDALLNRQ